MLILIDGYNVIAPVAPPGKNPASDWLHRERMTLIDRLANQLDSRLAAQTCVVFDASARSRRALGIEGTLNSTYRIREIEVRFAVNHNEADDLIEELIAVHSAPKRLTVISSDHRLQAAARRSGATAFDSQPWLDSLLDGRLMLAITWPPAERDAGGQANDVGLAGDAEKASAVDETTVDQWMQAFGITKDSASRRSSPGANADRQNLHGRADDATLGSPGLEKNAAKKPAPATDQSQDLAQNKPLSAAKTKKAPKKPTNSKPADSKPLGDPKRRIESENPFPDGYGEDLL